MLKHMPPPCSQVLCTTSTLAQGMNLPARLVSGGRQRCLPALCDWDLVYQPCLKSPLDACTPCLTLPCPVTYSGGPTPLPPGALLPTSPPCPPAGGHQGHATLRGQRGRRCFWLPGVRAQHLPANGGARGQAAVRHGGGGRHHDPAHGGLGPQLPGSEAACLAGNFPPDTSNSYIPRPPTPCPPACPPRPQHVQRYEQLTNGSEVVESTLREVLPEFINAEIMLRTIGDVAQVTGALWAGGG